MRIGVGLSIPELATRGGKFSPASLFTGGAKGVWYSPDDYSTLFQDSAGTTPVTAVEQPVGLMLDKSQGLVLGPELVVNGDFSSSAGWTAAAGWAITGGKAVATAAASGSVLSRNITVTTGVLCKVQYTISDFSSGSFALKVGGTLGTVRSANGTYVEYIVAGAGGLVELQVRTVGGSTLSVDDVSVKELPGNHASQSTAASRPVLRARYNLLTYSEQFDNAGWAKRSAGTVTTVTANTTVAPDGTLTADTFSDVSTSDYAQIDNGSVTAGIANTTYTFSLYVLKDAVTSRFPEFLLLDNTNSLGVCIQLNTSTGAVANRTVIGSPTYTTTVESAGLYWRLIHTIRTGGSATTLTAFIRPVMSATLGGAVDSSLTGSIVVWGAQLVTGSSAGTYQRIAAATDYATAGFLPYLALDGTDDSFATGSISFTSTDSVAVCAGITKNSDSATGMVVELSDTINSGSFRIAAPFGGGAANFYFESIGTTRSAATGTTFTAPITAVVTGLGTISTDQSILRVNGTQSATNTADQGTGNYGNYPLYIGRRNNASVPFNGRIYQMVVVGKTLSASELASTEAFVNTKTGAY